MFAMFPPLPPEILRMIFAFVAYRRTFCDVLATSRQFCQLVEPLLYARITFPIGSSSRATLRRLQSLSESLETSNGRRAPYIRTIHFEPIRGEDGRALIDKILAKTVNLKNLEFFTFPDQFPRSCHQGSRFALTSLCITIYSWDPCLPLFLDSQTSLEKLYLVRPSPFAGRTPTFSSTSFPNLRTLILVSVQHHAFLSTSARIRALRVKGIQNAPHLPVRAQSMDSSVQVLSCPTTQTMTGMRLLLPNLEWLELLNPTKITTISAWYPHNLKLRGIRLPRFDAPSSQHDMRCLFDALPTLEFVELTGEAPDFAPKRWYRDAPAPTPIRWLCEPCQEWLADWVEDVVVIE